MENIIISDDVLHNILSRLSAKPLMRFRCVSKHWNSLITDPYFINSRSRRTILISPKMIFYHPHYIYALDDKHQNAMKHTYPFKGIIQKSDVVGTFNGIVIWVLQKFSVYCSPIFILYNPLTRAAKKLPDAPYNPCCATSWMDTVCGFGNGKILLTRGWCICNRNIPYCDVFSLEKGSWTTPKTTFRGRKYVDQVGMYLNGFFHWIELLENLSIVVLDVKEMVATRIPEPNLSRDDYDRESPGLGTLHGCLSLITKWRNGFDVYMLINKEQSEWSKQYSFAYRCDYKEENLLNVCILEDGRIVVGDDVSNQIIICHLSQRYYNIFKVHSQIASFKNAVEYVESLVSPSDICPI